MLGSVAVHSPASRASSAPRPARTREVNATFPEDYPASISLAGKDAVFAVKVKEVAAPIAPDRRRVRQDAGRRVARAKLKRSKKRLGSEYGATWRAEAEAQLLDALDKAHEFGCRRRWWTSEFDGIWKQLTRRPGRPASRSPTRARPRRSCARSIARSPSGGCASAWSIGEIGEQEQASRSPRRSCAGADRAGAPLSRPGDSRSTSTTGRTRRRCSSCVRRSSRTRWSTSSSRSGQGRQEGRRASGAAAPMATRTDRETIDHGHDHDHDHDHDHAHDHSSTTPRP